MKVKFTDGFFAEKWTMKVLREKFGNVEISDNPDFLFCSTDYKADRFNYDCARIFITGENVVPDFNSVDYAIGFHNISFEDRYIRVPLYCFYEEDYRIALKKHIDYVSDKEKKFCNFIYSNGESVMKERDEFFHLLSEYKQVDSGGKHLNNIGRRIDDKREFQRQYKFSIAFENASANGYTTEKILQAFSAGTIPIYYGNPEISKEFNPKSFVNCHDYNNFDEVIKRIEEIDNSWEIYDSIMREPIFVNMNNRDNPLQSYEKYIYDICSQNPKEAIRRCNEGWGKRLQEEAKEYYSYFAEKNNGSIKSKILRHLIK